ncbi:GFA family protein [Altererythrobacter sp. BO-6]|uniref:GFA family protein n=1 Tax=Altererythrobacter sp. BO-6 TaxID=2604537 RepID=UPI0013E191E7|nr:GFA family protein [Altererythrobacter sp. BO-6]QIG54568.1 GFA family protein [Altererythrobacter sp. BO-6]
MSETRSGGCLCGAVRYEVAWPPLGVSACHCTHCQKQSGSALSVIARVPREALKMTGVLTDFHDTAESGGSVIRRFCAKCGSPLISEIPQGQSAAFLFIKTGTLDDTSGASPTSHWWTSSAQEWFNFPDDAVMMERQ